MIGKAFIVAAMLLALCAVSASAQRRNGRVPRIDRVQRNNFPSMNRLGRSVFDRLDMNNDGYISMFEWNGNRRTFDRVDFNNDGMISRMEWRMRRRGR